MVPKMPPAEPEPPAFIPPEPEPWPSNAPAISGIYPHLAMYNQHEECGTGAIVHWADRLWVVTYAPHSPGGSSDKLYEIDLSLAASIRPESLGGTPANRMIHTESQQLFIGPYAIDAQRNVRQIPYAGMPGRPTATARHLTDPENLVYTMTMEEGLYEIDVRSLGVTELFADSNGGRGGQHLPGYHGKGGYTAQGLLVYSNNGEPGAEASPLSREPAGALGAYDGSNWTVVERAQYTEVTGPGGLYGNASPDEPLWALGWDFRSVKLRVLDAGGWREYRLPKASNTYDGRHGWHTEWPRIRAVGDVLGKDQWLMTMHGMFWRFPRGFSKANSAGIRPLSSYLKIIGDFEVARNWLIFGTDDSATDTFQDGPNPLVPQSHSNLWFLPPRELTELGPREGTGGPWLNDAVKPDQPSTPYLFAGYDRRLLHLAHDADEDVTFKLEVDSGTGEWQPLSEVVVPAQGYVYRWFADDAPGEWIRITANRTCMATAFFDYSSAAERPLEPAAAFSALSDSARPESLGLVAPAALSDGGNLRLVAWREQAGSAAEGRYYELTPDLDLVQRQDSTRAAQLFAVGSVTSRGYEVDAASVLVTSSGRRYRLPKGDAKLDAFQHRGRREVVTERQLFNAHGTLYELPYDISGGFAKIRPIATHNLGIYDFASWRGLLALSGTTPSSGAVDQHHVVSADGFSSVWLGAIDDLWRLGKPRGTGGPWKDSQAAAGIPSDPYLFYGYDRKTLTLSHDAAESVRVRVEVDITGEGDWHLYRSFDVGAGQITDHEFEPGYSARWIRFTTDRDVRASALLQYR
jgi:hypothetical protein